MVLHGSMVMYHSPDLYNVLFHKNLYLLENYAFYRSKKYFLAIKNPVCKNP